MTAISELSCRELLLGYRTGKFSPVDAVEACARRIEQARPLGAFTTVCLERAIEEARSVERAYFNHEERRPLAGVPFAVKDLFDSADVRTTYGSPMFRDNKPHRDATAVRRARDAGAILVGKTSTHEFAWGITSVNPAMGTSRNPWAPSRVSGGSSGGSAVALASRQVPLALGSDTGGSIRVPSAFCGTVGLKPTYGRVSLAGAWPLAHSLDHPGPMAREPGDVALLLAAIAGFDPSDAASENRAVDALDGEGARGVEGIRIGICEDLHLVELDSDVRRAFTSATDTLKGLGAQLVEVKFPPAASVYSTFSVIQRSEALFTHRRAGLWPARRDEYGADVRARLELATHGGLDDYLAASADRERIRAAFARLFEETDLLLTPVAPGPPIEIGSESLVHLGKSIDFREYVMSFTVPQDLAGVPACAVRAGFDRLGIPIGMQFTGPPWGEARVLSAAQVFFQATTGLQARWPELAVTV